MRRQADVGRVLGATLGPATSGDDGGRGKSFLLGADLIDSTARKHRDELHSERNRTGRRIWSDTGGLRLERQINEKEEIS